ncbi:hypothetical protein ACLKA7_002174 [Drosophila subpalustris]
MLLMLTDPPEIIRKPQNQGVRVGGVASFYCAARGDPPPSIVWRKNGKKVSGTQSRYTVLEQPGGVSILRIEPVRAGRDDAPYECVAENGVGDAVSADATLTIYEGDKTPAGFPVITQGPGTRVIEVGHTVQMQCKAIGNPTPNIYWIKNQTKVDMTNPRYVINNVTGAPDKSQNNACPPDMTMLQWSPQPEVRSADGSGLVSHINRSQRVENEVPADGRQQAVEHADNAAIFGTLNET